MPQLFDVLVLVTFTVQPACVPVPVVTVPSVLPWVVQNDTEPAGAGLTHEMELVYLIESAKYASSAVTKFRRSDFMEAMYAFSFVLANFGIAIAAKMPMMTTTINSSISVKPLRFMSLSPRTGLRSECWTPGWGLLPDASVSLAAGLSRDRSE